MRKRILIWLAVPVVFAGVNLTARYASASSSICYQLTPLFTDERINIALFKIIGLNASPGQNAFTINGKWVGTCGGGTSVPVNGTIVVSTKGTVKGARMGLRSEVARTSCTPLTLECTTAEVTPKPRTWFCRLRNDTSGDTSTTFNLSSVTKDATCGVFEAGSAPPPEEVPVTGSDSGSGLLR
jgi:hypothetical protein